MAQDKPTDRPSQPQRNPAPRPRRENVKPGPPPESRNRDEIKETPVEPENPEWWRGDPGKRGEVL